jgi:predicted transcriptional regulator YdeE
MLNVQGNQAPKERQKILKKFEKCFTRPVAEQSMSPKDTAEISYGVCQEILTENMNMRHTAVLRLPTCS